jgi:RING-like zinc finger
MAEALTAIILVGLVVSSLSVYLNESNSEKRNRRKVVLDGCIFTVPAGAAAGKQEWIQSSSCSGGIGSSSSSSSSSSSFDYKVREATATAPVNTCSCGPKLQWPAKQLKKLRKRSSAGTVAMSAGERTLHGHPIYIESECSICLEELQQGCELLALGCGHTYHRACIMEHLHGHHFCAICKVTFFSAT